MAKELEVAPVGSWKKQKEEEIFRNKILQERREKIEREKIQKSVKKFVTVAGFSLFVAVNVAGNVKNIAEDLDHSMKVNEAFMPISNKALEIVSENTHRAKNGYTEVSEPQYDHYGMAKDIENYTLEFGRLQGDALLAAVLEASTDNAYQNDDRIVNALSDNFTEADTALEYIHSLGYETQEDYLNDMKEAWYRENQKREVIEKYADTESELKR